MAALTHAIPKMWETVVQCVSPSVATMEVVVPSSTCSASTPWTYNVHAIPECISHILRRTAEEEEAGPLLQSLLSPASFSQWAETSLYGPQAQHCALRMRNLPCLFTKCCFICYLSKAASRGVKVLKRRRGYRSVVPGVGRVSC